MATSIVHSAQNNGAGTTLSFTSATAGNTLVVASSWNFVGGNTVTDNLNYTWTELSAYRLLFQNAGWSAEFFIKVAVGGENEVALSTNTVEQICYWEISGLGPSPCIDNVEYTQVNNSGTTDIGFIGFYTTDSTDAILGYAAQNGATGVIKAWTFTGPMTNISTTTNSCRGIGGYYVPGTGLSDATFVANWTASNNAGLMLLAIGQGVHLLSSGGGGK